MKYAWGRPVLSPSNIHFSFSGFPPCGQIIRKIVAGNFQAQQ
jgi:hypothetical protein